MSTYFKCRGYFITGTDTNVGKTFFSVYLLKHWAKLGYQTAALKPIATGAEKKNDQLINNDAYALQQACTLKLSYDQVNPIVFACPTSPTIAAHMTSHPLTVNAILNCCKPILETSFDRIVIEGIGGWLVPLNDKETMADVACQLELPIILVVGIRLGCLNHALLTWQCLQQTGLPIFWVANQLTPDNAYTYQTIQTLINWLKCQPLDKLPFFKG